MARAAVDLPLDDLYKMDVDRLQRFARETGAHIVVTSTWRHKMAASEMIAMFALYGFIDAPIIGMTPDLRASANRMRIPRDGEQRFHGIVNTDSTAT